MTKEAELLPCPFCGSTPEQRWINSPDIFDFTISCENADCEVIVESVGNSQAEAGENWNTRAASPPVQIEEAARRAAEKIIQNYHIITDISHVMELGDDEYEVEILTPLITAEFASSTAQGWQYVHDYQADLIRQDGFMCEQHPGKDFPHDDCAGPGMPWLVEGKADVLALVAQGWMGIESAPKGRKILVAYRNPQGNWRRVCARYYEAETLENVMDGEWCDAGWYEECEGQETIFLVEYPPELWCELPPPPTTEVAKD